VLLRASTEATWITAPEVSGKAVNINDSYHPPPGLLQPSSLHFSSSALFKGNNPAQSKGKVLLARKLFFKSDSLVFIAFQSIDPITSDHSF